MKEDFQNRYEEVEDEPNVNHFHVACSWQIIAYTEQKMIELKGFDNNFNFNFSINILTKNKKKTL